MSRLFCPCSCLHVTLLSLPISLLPCAAGRIARRCSSSCGPQTLPAGAGISSSKQDLHIVYVILCFVARIKSLLPPNSASESFIIHHPDRIYSPDHGFSRGDGVALNPLAAGHSTGSATGRTSGFSSHLCRGFAPTQPAGGMAGPAAGQPFHRSGFYVSPWP